MTAWSPGLRDKAAGGLLRLLARSVWRDSDRGPTLAAAVHRLLADPNPVVRHQAAQGLPLLHHSEPPEQQFTAVRSLLLAEADPHVVTVLMQVLVRLAGRVPAQADNVLSELSQVPAGVFLRSLNGTTESGQSGQGSHQESDRDGESSAWSGLDGPAEAAGPLLAYLATVAQTPFASNALADWFGDPITYEDRVQRLLHQLRSYLNRPDGEGQENAFRLLTAAAQAAADTWTALVAQASGGAEPLSEPETAQARAATLVAYGIAQQLYFASGTFDERRAGQREPEERGEPETFARRALPVLQVCAQVTEPQVTHYVVETLIHIAEVFQRETLLAVAAAIPERGGYVTDPLAAKAVLPYLRRLVAEHRNLVLFDEEGTSAFRHLLQALAGAGDPDALGMAYTFADVFR